MSAEADKPLAVFRSTRARVTWVLWLAFVAFNIGDVVVRSRDRTGLVVVLILLILTALLWQLDRRPRVTAHPAGVRLRGGFRDVWVPWRQIEDMDARDVLVIHTPFGSYRSPAVAARLGDMFRIWQRGAAANAATLSVNPRRTPVTFAVAELTRLRGEHLPTSDQGRPVVTVRWVEIGVIVVLLVALVVTLAT